MSTLLSLNSIRNRYVSALLKKDYLIDELNEMSLPELRELMDKEFPMVFVSTSVTASGGITVTVEKKAA